MGGHTNENTISVTVSRSDLLLYSLCPVDTFQAVYEAVLQLLYLNSSATSSKSVAAACCQLLTTLTADRSHVMEFRATRVWRMAVKAKTPAAKRRIGALLKKYQDLKTEAAPWVDMRLVSVLYSQYATSSCRT